MRAFFRRASRGLQEGGFLGGFRRAAGMQKEGFLLESFVPEGFLFDGIFPKGFLVASGWLPEDCFRAMRG